MRKILAFVLAAIMIPFCFSGCAGGIKLTLDKSSVTLTKKGGTIQISAFLGETDVTSEAEWQSDKTGVCTVSAGLITAVANGKATVSAKKDGKTAKVNVTVSISGQTDTLELDKNEVTITEKDGSVTVSAFAGGSKVTDAVWTSDNPSVCTVQNGVITAKEYGYTIVNAEKDGQTDSVKVTVQRWADAPEVKNVYYDNFSQFTGDTWHFVNYGWGQNGVLASNAMYSRSPGVLNAYDASGGIVVLPSYGDYYSAANKRGQGTCLISSDAYGPGLYEVRMKVVPRFGPCSAIWPYYTNSEQGWNTEAEQEYTEIDIIEAPATGRGFNGYGGVTYTKYFYEQNGYTTQTNANLKRTSKGVSVTAESPINDGEWHIYAAEWRTDPKTGNNGVAYYMDGKEVAFTELTPQYSAQLWIGNWFPNNATDWLGIADFDEAYMYVDWVRITENEDPFIYREPDLGGCLSASTAKQLAGNPLPINNYISNGTFSVAGASDSAALGWSLTNAARSGKSIKLQSGGKMSQLVSAQYEGYTFDLSVTASAGVGGTVKVYAEYYRFSYSGSNANKTSVINGGVKVGQSQTIEFDSAASTTKNLVFTVQADEDITRPAGALNDVNNIRIVIESTGSSGTVTKAQMFLKKDMLG